MTKAKLFYAALMISIFAVSTYAQSRAATESRARVATRQTRNTANVDMLSRVEQRLESLRAKVLELQMRELELQGRIADLDYQMSPEAIQRSLAFVGSVRPMDELRDALRHRLEGDKMRVTRQLEVITATRERLETSISGTEAEIQRLHQQLDSR